MENVVSILPAKHQHVSIFILSILACLLACQLKAPPNRAASMAVNVFYGSVLLQLRHC